MSASRTTRNRGFWLRRILFASVLGSFAVVGVCLFALHQLSNPYRQPVGNPPEWLAAQDVVLPGDVSGWYSTSPDDHASVLLLHGVRSDRRSMLGRAKFLRESGFSVLLIDLPAHGESAGQSITFGHKESIAVTAAVDFLKSKTPEIPTFIIGSSLGGAAALLSDPPPDVAAMVLEAVYDDIDNAFENRVRLRVGDKGASLARTVLPLLSSILGIDREILRPVEAAASSDTPVLVMAGTLDQRTTVDDTQRLFAAFKGPKQLWLVEGAKHQNLFRFSEREYRRVVGAFLEGVIADLE
ncbi:MAG: alpha/beta fold hydrolase [Pseudomonadota bacterium]